MLKQKPTGRGKKEEKEWQEREGRGPRRRKGDREYMQSRTGRCRQNRVPWEHGQGKKGTNAAAMDPPRAYSGAGGRTKNKKRYMYQVLGHASDGEKKLAAAQRLWVWFSAMSGGLRLRLCQGLDDFHGWSPHAPLGREGGGRRNGGAILGLFLGGLHVPMQRRWMVKAWLSFHVQWRLEPTNHASERCCRWC